MQTNKQKPSCALQFFMTDEEELIFQNFLIHHHDSFLEKPAATLSNNSLYAALYLPPSLTGAVACY